jgi:hypothetical protein
MKKSVFLVFLMAIAVFSCKRPESKRENLQNSISEFSKKHSDLNLVTRYYPEEYTEVQTDSIIANTFKVRIKNYSNMHSQILLSSETNDTKTKFNYHRVFESEITIAIATKQIFNTTIKAQDFKDIAQPEFWNNATLEQVWVNQETSNNKELHLEISFINPKNKTYKLYELMVTTEGEQHLKLIEEYS